MPMTQVSARSLLSALVLLAPLGARAAPDPGYRVTLAPRSSDGQTITSVDVKLVISGLAVAKDAPALQLPLVISNVDTAATLIGALDARDARGPVRLVPREETLPDTAVRDSVAGGPARVWVAPRALEGPITVHYTVPAQATLPPRGPAPPFSFSADGGGVSAAGNVFLLMPPGDHHYRTTFGFDLAQAPRGSRGVSSLGEGTVTASEPLDASDLTSSFFMAGKIGTWPARMPQGGGFFGAWQGHPAFDAGALLAWTGTLHGHYAQMFGQGKSPPYGVFLRYNPINAGGGVGLTRSFVTTFGQGRGSDVDAIKLTLAHEMFHTFQPYITQPAGLASSWFGEGLATFYQARLPFRFGLIDADAYLRDINWTAARYYTSIMARVPNAVVPERFWADTRIRTLPYDRGMLYFAQLDDRLRKASDGKTSLDDLVMAMLARQSGGKATSNADWEALLAQHLGQDAVADFHAFLEGAMPLPASDAFGPCFHRVTRPMRRYELGFATDVLAEPRRVVRGLVAGSAAAQAGLRDGDEIVDPVPQDGIQGEQTQTLTLRIRREGKVFPITYLPRGETVDAWQWERTSPAKAGTTEHCAL